MHHHCGRTKRHEHTESRVRPASIRSLQAVWHESGRHRGADTRLEAIPRGQVTRITALQLRNRKRLPGFREREVVCRLTDDFKPAEPRVAIVERKIGLESKPFEPCPDSSLRPDATVVAQILSPRKVL